MKLFKTLSIGLLCVLAVINATAQEGGVTMPINATDGHVEYQAVVDVAGVSPADLHKRAEHWFNTYFKNPGSVIQNNDAASGSIDGQHTINIYNVQKDNILKGKVKYRVKVEAKDGRYRYTVNDVFFIRSPKLYIEEWMVDNDENREYNFQYVKQVKEHIESLIEDLEKTMAQPVPGAKSDDW